MGPGSGRLVLVHLASGIGNIVLATPLLLVLSREGYTMDVLVEGDYPDTAELLRDWSAVRAVFNGRMGQQPIGRYEAIVPAVPPFYWPSYARRYTSRTDCVPRPPDALFYRDEQSYYLEFARALGCDFAERPYHFLPISPLAHGEVTSETVILAPGCKTGEMAAKRWPHFPRLAEMFEDVVLVGTLDDLHKLDGTAMGFPRHVRSLVGRLSLRETAGVLAAAGTVVANDSGLGHVAGAVGTPTILLFGPTPHITLGQFPPNVKVLRAGLRCEPCWFSERFIACTGRVDCLDRLPVDVVAAAVLEMQGRTQ